MHPPRARNEDESEAGEFLPIKKDEVMRKVFNSERLRAAVITNMKKRLVWSGVSGSLNEVRNMIFSEKYQLKHCLASRGGGRSKVRGKIT